MKNRISISKRILSIVVSLMILLSVPGYFPNGFLQLDFSMKANAEEIITTETITSQEPLIKNGVYQISTVDELYWFASLVNGTLDDVAQNTSADAVLTRDIVVNDNLLSSIVKDADGSVTNDDNFDSWTPIGQNKYYGTFDGQGHTISGLYVNNSSTNHVGLFAQIFDNGEMYATIKNVNVADSYLCGGRYMGGICANMSRNKSEGRCVIQNCSFDGVIISSSTYVGGICGKTDGGLIEKCYNKGSIKRYDANSLGNMFGGICGDVDTVYVTIKNCYNLGDITGADGVGGIAGRVTNSNVQNCFSVGVIKGTRNVACIVGYSSNASIADCYYYAEKYVDIGGGSGTVIGPVTGGTGGTGGTSVIPSITLTTAFDDANATLKMLSAFKNGEVTYLLNGSTSEGELVWGQKLGTDDYPVLDGATVYYVDHIKCDSKTIVAKEYRNKNEPVYDHTFVSERCTGCGSYEPATMVTKDNYKKLKLSSDYIGYYAISSLNDLYWLANFVNGTLIDKNQNVSANAVLTNDIVINKNLLSSILKDADGNVTNGSSFTSWTPIGTDASKYNGIFDGNNHTISGLYFNDDEYSNVGFLGKTDVYAQIKNLGIIDSYFYAKNYVGGLCGYNDKNNSMYPITHSYFKGEVSVKGDEDSKYYYTAAGGLCGYSARGEFENCYCIGTVSARGGNTVYVGGLCGGGYYTRIKNCYSYTELSAGGSNYKLGGILGCYDNVTINNCFYNTDKFSGNGVGSNYSTTGVSFRGVDSDTFLNGEIAYYLQNDQEAQVWGQTIGTDEVPIFSDAKVYQNVEYSGCSQKSDIKLIEYSNTCEETKFDIPHNYVERRCTLCGGCLPATLVTEDNYAELKLSSDYIGYYAISRMADLYWFAELVNGTLEDVAQDKSANAVLTNNIVINKNLLSSILKDADGNVTNGSSFTSWTPIGNIDNKYSGTFDGQGHTISGLYLDEKIRYVGLFGLIEENGIIKNVGIVDSFFKAKGEYVGAVCGYNGGSIINCYNMGVILGDKKIAYMNGCYIGGVCGYNDGSIINCYNTGNIIGYNGGCCVGGVCGYSACSIINCYNTGNVSIDGIYVSMSVSFVRAGGVCGRVSASVISNCYNSGNVSINNKADVDMDMLMVHIGGVCGIDGRVNNNYSTISNCYNTGSVSVQENSGEYVYIGGVSGENGTGSSILNSYFNTQTFSGNAVGENEGTVSDNVKGMDNHAFASGEVAYLLNGGVTDGTQVWYQTKTTDEYPQFEGKTIYYNEAADPQYYNARIGDVNCDSYIDVRDIIRMKKNFESGKHPESSDLNSDDKVDADDMVKLKKYLLTGSMSAS